MVYFSQRATDESETPVSTEISDLIASLPAGVHPSVFNGAHENGELRFARRTDLERWASAARVADQLSRVEDFAIFQVLPAGVGEELQPSYLGAGETGKVLGVPREQVEAWVADGTIPAASKRKIEPSTLTTVAEAGAIPAPVWSRFYELAF